MAHGYGRLGAWMVLALSAGLVGCAGTKQHPSGDAAAAGGATGPSGTGGSGGGGSPTDGPGRVIGVDALGDAACASASQRAQQVPLDIYIMATARPR